MFPSRQDVDPASLLLVAVSEHDVSVRERSLVVWWKFFESDNRVRERCRRPGVPFHQLASDAVSQYGIAQLVSDVCLRDF